MSQNRNLPQDMSPFMEYLTHWNRPEAQGFTLTSSINSSNVESSWPIMSHPSSRLTKKSSESLFSLSTIDLLFLLKTLDRRISLFKFQIPRPSLPKWWKARAYRYIHSLSGKLNRNFKNIDWKWRHRSLTSPAIHLIRLAISLSVLITTSCPDG